MKVTSLYFRPKVTYPERLYGVKIMKIRMIENLPLGHLSQQFGRKCLPCPWLLKPARIASSGGGYGVCRLLAGGEKYRKEINSFFIH
jgi:hypothetical protein